MAQWIATIGELDREFECDAARIEEAVLLTMVWLDSLDGKPTGHWSRVEGEPERHTIEVSLPILERTLRPWPLYFFKWWRVKSRTVEHTARLSLSVIHAEMSPDERIEFCRSVGLPL